MIAQHDFDSLPRASCTLNTQEALHRAACISSYSARACRYRAFCLFYLCHLCATASVLGAVVATGCTEQGQAVLGSLLLSEGGHGAQKPGRADQRTDHKGLLPAVCYFPTSKPELVHAKHPHAAVGVVGIVEQLNDAMEWFKPTFLGSEWGLYSHV